jgi:hypothetical protein
MVAAAVVYVTPAEAGDCKGCALVAKTGEGFCCGKGMAFGVPVSSEKLYQTLVGYKVDAAHMKCPGCKKAAKTNGECTHCKVGMADGKAYHSTYAHTLAKGMPMPASKAAHCGGCKTAYEKNSRCSACDVGFVAGRAFKQKSQHESAKAALEVITTAAKASSHCEACAVAMVTDGKCSHCNVAFKGGKKAG